MKMQVFELIEYAQPVFELTDLESTVANRDEVVRMIIIAHT